MDAELIETEYIRSLFKDYPLANNLLDEVIQFYGSSFTIRRAVMADDRSRYTLNVDAQHLKFNGAVINLDTSTDRQAAAACHELLHLQLPIRSFPRIRSLNLTSVQETVSLRIVSAQISATNVIDHDIFKDDFVKVGFPLGQLLVASPENINYKKVARDSRDQTIPPQLNFVNWNWWCTEYFRHYMSMTHGLKQSESLVDKVSQWGVKAVPGFKSGMDRMREWISAGQHLQPTTYPAAIRKLFDIIQLPKITGFCVLERDSNNQIVVRGL